MMTTAASATLAEEWHEYELSDVPEDATPHLRREVRRAFYAGARRLIWLQQHVPFEANLASVEAVCRGWHNEVEQFERHVEAGIV